MSVCERRNSIAAIVFRLADKERTHVHERFLAGLDAETRAELTHTGICGRVTVDARASA